MDLKNLKNYIETNKIPAFRLKQIIKAFYQDGLSCFSEISTLPKDLREKMDKDIDILSFCPEDIQEDSKDRAKKALLELRDGELIETVLMPGSKEDSWTACISSQVGCAMGCAFCATGRLGFKRNLNYEEIVDQVLFWKQELKKEKPDEVLSNVVFMGMGEPLNNWAEVKKSIEKLGDENLFNLASRHISVSTVGVTDKIKTLAREFPQINLAVSLIFPTDEQRDVYMPINKKYSTKDLISALNYYLETTNRKVFIEYVLFKDINDGEEEAKNLNDIFQRIDKKQLIHINLIRYNSTENNFLPSTKDKTLEFKKILDKYRISSSIRRSWGSGISAACGQLAGK